MMMSRNVMGIVGFFAGALVAGVVVYVVAGSPDDHVGHAHADADDATLYTCGMHPQVIRDAPGDCPICGMALVPMSAGKKEEAAPSGPCTDDNALYWRAPMDPTFISNAPGKSPMGMALVPVCEASGPGQVAVDPRIMQSMGVRTALVRRGPLERTLRTVARVEANERKRVVVTSKVAGWIEKLYVNETGQFVRRGQPLFSIYSPQVVAGQEEYLLAHRQGNELLARSARDRLLFWDFTKKQIAALEARDKPSKALTIFSPTTGYVVHKNAVEGSKVRSDMTLFKIVDLSTVWVQADVYEYEVPWMEVGQTADLSLAYSPGRTFEGKLSYIYPYVDETSRTVRVRLEFKNPGLVMKPGMFGSVRIRTTTKEDQVLLPSKAIIRTGERNIVFLDVGDGSYKAAEVKLGDEGDAGLVAVLEGLHPGQRIVTSGQFLLDSESQLNETLQKMMAPPEPDGSAPAAGGPASGPAMGPANGPASGPSDSPASMPGMDHGAQP